MNALVKPPVWDDHNDKLSLSAIVQACVTVDSAHPAIDVLDLFLADRELRVIPVVDSGRPVGMVNRHTMVEMFSRPFRRDLFGRRPVSDFMDTTPIVVHVDTDIDELAQKLVSAGLQQMLDGFLVVGAGGDYAGIGNAQNLLSEVTKRKQAHLYQLAHFDALTGLPNRVLFRDRLTVAINHAARAGSRVAVAFVDIYHFKRINDTLGHPAGDELLQVVAQRLESGVRRSDTLARMGGDEFTLVLTNLDSPAGAARAIRKLREHLCQPVVLDDHEVVVTASIGVAMYPDDAPGMDELVRKADIALYAAKHAGRDTYSFFDRNHEVFDDSRLYLENELRTALNQGAIHPAFQAIVDAHTGAVVAVEALARWRHPDKGMIPPAQFVPLAEDTGLIAQLGRSINRDAATALKALPASDNVRLSLNVSALEIRKGDFVQSLLRQLESGGLAPERVQLEITERLLLEPSTELLQKLQALRESGIRIAIDDFGVGSTSLRLLHKLPVDVLKIDRTFIAGSDEDPRVETLVRAIIDMGHALDLQIVAEGVETEQQAKRLRQCGCDLLQGYLFCEPATPAEFGRWLSIQGRTPTVAAASGA